ncbi:Leucine-rich repeats and immunoglobulin-like domains protein 2, partial [Geodia barretti]
NLGQNELSYLPENVFQYTPNLYYLLLNGNNLETIGVRVFRDLQRLIQLSLYENAIFSMVEGALYGTTSLFYLQWNFDPSDISSGNSLICDCSALWLHRYIQEKGRRIETTVYCAGPPDLNGTDITALSEEHFGCDDLSEDSLQMRVEPSCDSLVVRRGGCLRVTCTSTPSGRTSWTRLGRSSTAVAAHTCRSYSSCVAQSGESELVIGDASDQDVGNYICTATLKNVTTAVTCHVSLGEPPSVDLGPRDQYLGWPGDTAYFRVRVSGQPHPSVEWHHESPHGTRSR